MQKTIHVIGAGLAGCEAAWQIANLGIEVKLYEMKPNKKTPAHHRDSFAELVCSNSMRSNQLENAAGLLKEELRLLGSLIMKCADMHSVPAGGALAVDRDAFSNEVTKSVREHERITIINKEVTILDPGKLYVIATGPLTSDAFSAYIRDMLGGQYLYFFDAAAPIVRYDSIDMSVAYRASRYGKGTDDYINCPMDKETYDKFWNELTKAETTELMDFEDGSVFEGCMPIEVMAKRGYDTMRFGPLKPVGLTNPVTGREPWAVVQLRQDNREGSLFNIVGFQTHLKWGEQKRVFSMIPGLRNAEFARYGVMHRNTYINSPGILDNTYRMINSPLVYFAGQITGVEGYVESTSSGLTAGINAALFLLEKKPRVFPDTTAIGALAHYVSSTYISKFQPMNVNFGIIKGLDKKIRNKHERNRMLADRALDQLKVFV